MKSTQTPTMPQDVTTALAILFRRLDAHAEQIAANAEHSARLEAKIADLQRQLNVRNNADRILMEKMTK